ncbi:hypothetical protein [Candidatus Nitrosotenuis uzonensis]|uniref:KaiC-like domain-containing protein n=1 Tax=Candidatus Nitrosotenuis uzonensis TaxID=1407055 RepID=A0A812EVI0_9ARCH|nr:hypothetical protein [Candidatus Nitrosotenuis uzonensis]CAE6489653.1 conserved hypothetical protein [Candidatus Nitrosotenuis uzonensis]
MHKNQSGHPVEEILKILSSQTLNSISFDDAVAKTYFFHKISMLLRIPTLYFDFDMLYSGYTTSGILEKGGNTEIIVPTADRIKEDLAAGVEKISLNKYLVIFDSLNGLFTMLDQKDAGRLVNSMVMLLTSAGRYSSSTILIGSISKFREGQGWILSALGRRVVEIEKMNIISVKKQKSYFQLSLVDHNNFTKSSIQFDLDAM